MERGNAGRRLGDDRPDLTWRGDPGDPAEVELDAGRTRRFNATQQDRARFINIESHDLR